MLDMERALEKKGYDFLIINPIQHNSNKFSGNKSEISEKQTRRNNSPLDLTPKHKY